MDAKKRRGAGKPDALDAHQIAAATLPLLVEGLRRPVTFFVPPVLLQDEGVLACWPRHDCRPQSSMIKTHRGCCHRVR